MTIGLEKIYKSSLIHILEECSKELEDLNLLKIKGTRKLYNDNNLTNDQITFQEETLNQYIVLKQKEALEGGVGGFKDELIRVDIHKNIKNSIDYDHIISSLHGKDIIIQNSFYHLNNRYKYFSDDIEYCVRDYIKVFKTLKLVNFLSEQKQVDDIILSQNSYKVMVLFFAAQKNSDSLKRFNNYLKTNPILKEDLNQSLDKISYPENGQKISLFKWQKLIREKGITAMKIFSKADTIEDTIKKKKLEESINVTSFDKLKEIYSSIIFHRAEEFPELAKLIIRYPIDDKAFNACLEIHKSKKSEDKLPDITINGKDIGCAGYHLTKLQVKHPHLYILGYVLHCRLKPSNDEGLPFIKYAATLKTHGIYVLLKNKSKETTDNLLLTNQEEKIDYNKFNIVGAAYCWISQSGNLAIDSWDNLWSGNREKYDNIIALHFCKRLFSELGKYDIHRVTMGIGGYCEYLYEILNKKCNFTEYPELMLEGECSGKSYDSIYQNVIYESGDLIKERQNLCKKYNFLDPESLISLDQMKLIPQILELYDEEVWSIITKPSALYVHSLLGVEITDKINDIKNTELLDNLFSYEASRLYQLYGVDYFNFLLKKIDQEVDISIYTSNTLVEIYPLFSDVFIEGNRLHRLLHEKSADFIISLSLNESLNVLKAIDDQYHLDWLINKILEIDDQPRLERMLCYNALDFYKKHSKYIFRYLTTTDDELLDEFANSLLHSDELLDFFIKGQSPLLGQDIITNTVILE